LIKFKDTREYCEIEDYFYVEEQVTAEQILNFISAILKPEGFIFTRTYPQQVAGEDRIFVSYRYYLPSPTSKIVPSWQVEIENTIKKCIENLQEPHSGSYYRRKYGRPKKSTRPSKGEVISL